MTKTQDEKQTATHGTPRARSRGARATREAADPDVSANDVRLVGRLSNEPLVVDLPSGDSLVTFRISVPRRDQRSRSPQATGGQRVDSIPCTAWSAGLRRRIVGWRTGDTVEIVGSIRCRFYQAGGATRSRVEVEASAVKIVSRASGA